MATTSEEVWQLLGELISAQKETEQLLKQQAQESESSNSHYGNSRVIIASNYQ